MGLDRVGVSAGEASRRTGIPAPTLRSWDRRYGLGPASRDEGRHRRFSPDDLARLLAMRQLTECGVAAAEAAQLVRDSPDPAALIGDADWRANREDGRLADCSVVRALERASLALDRVRLDQLLRNSLADGVVEAWTGVIAPALRNLGEQIAATGQHVEAEHLLSVATSIALAQVPRATSSERVLLACGPDELHTLAFEALDAALAEAGMSARLLGARVPVESLTAAISRTGPQAVALWAHVEESANLAQLRAILVMRPRPPLVIVAGPGWRDVHQPGVLNPGSLSEAMDLLITSSA